MTIDRLPTRYERERHGPAWRRALSAVGVAVARLVIAAAVLWLLLSCAEPTARDAASAAYTRLHGELADRVETTADLDCLDAIEAAWRRAWDARREEDFAAWVLADGWRELPTCSDATFGGAP